MNFNRFRRFKIEIRKSAVFSNRVNRHLTEEPILRKIVLQWRAPSSRSRVAGTIQTMDIQSRGCGGGSGGEGRGPSYATGYWNVIHFSRSDGLFFLLRIYKANERTYLQIVREIVIRSWGSMQLFLDESSFLRFETTTPNFWEDFWSCQ